MSTSNLPMIIPSKCAWNHGRIIGQKRPLLPKHVWAIRVRLELANTVRDLALFNTAIDRKLRGCDLGKLKVPMSTPRALLRSAPQFFKARPKLRSGSRLQRGRANL